MIHVITRYYHYCLRASHCSHNHILAHSFRVCFYFFYFSFFIFFCVLLYDIHFHNNNNNNKTFCSAHHADRNRKCQDEKGTPDLLVNDEDCITIMLLLY